MTDHLGQRMYSQNVVLRGALLEDQWKEFLARCAAAMGMTPAGEPAVWRYPVDGKGGNGFTIIQPITESFLVVDTWTDHDGAYLHISSCKRFSVTDIVEPAGEFSLGVEFMGKAETLSLSPRGM